MGATKRQTVASGSPTDLAGAVSRLRKQFLQDFDPEYVENAIIPFYLAAMYQGERLSLPMIDVRFSKENAVPPHLWGLLSDDWKLNPDNGVSVFFTSLEKRGPDNLRKRIYMSATTPDLYRTMYGDKVRRSIDNLFSDQTAGKPLMRRYLDGYFNLYWNLHLGVASDAIPTEVRQVGESFNAVLAYRDPTLKIYYDNYQLVRSNRGFLERWIDERITDLINGRIAHPEKTFVHYWLENGGGGDDFRRKDVVFECFHNFLAFSQWGNMLYHTMLKLGKDTGDPDARDWFKRTMESNFDQADGAAFSPLERFVMELFRTISPNTGSISAVEETRIPPFERHGFVTSPHLATSVDPRHWKNPEQFDPDRYTSVPTSDQIDQARCEQIGFAQCPFDHGSLEVKDGRKGAMENSGFGTVYGTVDGQPLPVADYAGYAPFGFGYRRCAGEQLTVNVFEDVLRKVWQNKIEFGKLNVAHPEQVPIGPGMVVSDDVGFTRAA